MNKLDASLEFWQAARDFAFWAERADSNDEHAYVTAHARFTDLVNAAETWYQTPKE